MAENVKDVNGRTLKVGHIVTLMRYDNGLTYRIISINDGRVEMDTVPRGKFNLKMWRAGCNVRKLEPEELI